jgi:hypothetical protein
MLNAAIDQSLDKALSVLSLKKDIDNLRDSYRHDSDNNRLEINRFVRPE